MSENEKKRWQETLEIVERAVTAKSFSEDFDFLQEQYGDDPGMVAAARVGMIAEFFVETVGLDTLLLPPDEAPDALAQARQRLSELDFETPRVDLDEDELPYYEAFADFGALVFDQMGRAMEAMFNRYIAEEYDPTADPNELIAEALEMADDDLDEARDQISRAGAVALHGQPLWWRWEEEAYGPAAPWLRITATLVEDYTFGGDNPMGPPEEAREDIRAIINKVASEELAKETDEEPAVTPVDDLINELIERGEAPITEKQIALCQEHREEAISALIHLASDEDLQMENAPGEGYAPIRAVELLGKLEAEEAVPTLIDLVAESDSIDIIYSTASITLERLGPIARDGVVTFLRYSQDVDTKTALAGMLDSMADPDDEEAYQLLVDVWEESNWEYGKCLLGYPLIHFGGEEAAEMVRETLAEEDLDPIDHNELVAALEEAGMDAPTPMDVTQTSRIHRIVQDLVDPQELIDFAETRPERRETPEELAYEYADRAEKDLLRNVTFLVTILPEEILKDRIDDFIEAIETLTFDPIPEGTPDWASAAYSHLAESAGAEFRDFGIGLLLPFQVYLDQEVDSAESADELIATAREALPDTERARQCFGEAGALVLAGRPVWDLWPLETRDPLSNWMIALLGMRDLLEDLDRLPFQPSDEPFSRPSESQEEISPEADEIVDFLFAQSDHWIPAADRPNFSRHRSALIPALIEIVRTPVYARDSAPGRGWVPILATRVLGDLKAEEAADTLIWIVAMTEPTAYIHEAAIFSLAAMGSPALPAIKRYYRYGQSVIKKATLAEVLGLAGEDDPEVFHLLKEVWEAAGWTQNRRAVAMAFGDLGDRRAEPLLREAARDPRADALDRDYVWLALLELGAQASKPPQTLSNRLRTPAPSNPRVLYDELDIPQRVRYTAWGEAICPDCGDLMVKDESGRFIHLGRRSTRKRGRRH